MNNLIVTIIAISLAAAVAATSIYYGGNGYMATENRANASKYVNYLNQVAGVVNVWSQRNGGLMPNPASSFPTACGGNTTYCSVTQLQNMIGTRYIGIGAVPDGTDGSQLYYWDNTQMQNPVLLLRLGTSSAAKANCTAVETLRQGTAPAALRVYNGGTVDINRYMCGTFGCFQNDGTFGATGTSLYIVYSRLGQMPNTSLTDYPGPSCPTS